MDKWFEIWIHEEETNPHLGSLSRAIDPHGVEKQVQCVIVAFLVRNLEKC